MPKISEAAAAARRNHILDVAAHCFARRGLQVSVDDICAAAGVSKGALYIYFPSKDDLIQGLADRHPADIRPIAEADSLERLCDALLDRTAHTDATAPRFELEAWTYSLNNDALHARLLSNASALRTAIATALKAIQARTGRRAVGAPEVCAAIIETYALGLVAKGALGDAPADGSEGLRVLLHALAPQPAGPTTKPSIAGDRRRRQPHGS